MTTNCPEHRPFDLSPNRGDRSGTGRHGDLSPVSAALRADTGGHPAPADRPSVIKALRGLIDVRIPGGCDTCDATTTLAEETPGCFVGLVGHDQDCPTWQSICRHRAGGSG